MGTRRCRFESYFAHLKNKNVLSSNGLGFNALNVEIPVQIRSTHQKYAQPNRAGAIQAQLAIAATMHRNLRVRIPYL